MVAVELERLMGEATIHCHGIQLIPLEAEPSDEHHMSRLGRDYLKVGQIVEMFRQKDVRIIAVNDSTDTLHGDDDFLPFRNIMNEWYAKDTRKKIRSTFKAKGDSGKHVASATPYGYLMP